MTWTRNRGGFLFGLSWVNDPTWPDHFYLGWWVLTCKVTRKALARPTMTDIAAMYWDRRSEPNPADVAKMAEAAYEALDGE